MAGTVGHAGCMSFSKTLLPVGEGGAVVTDDAEFAAKVRSLRSHAMTTVTWDRHRGHADSYDIVDIGFNYRLDEPRAALGLSRLPVSMRTSPSGVALPAPIANGSLRSPGSS